MKCPKCQESALGRIRTARPLGLWSCPNCFGVWVPEGRAATVDPPPELPEQESASPAAPADERTGLCPEDHGLMTRARVFAGAEADDYFVERCSRCLGVWFDAGEWPRLAAADLAEGLFVLWNEDWQHEQRTARQQAAYRAELTAKLGTQLTSEIRALAAQLREHPARSLGLGLLLRELGREANSPPTTRV